VAGWVGEGWGGVGTHVKNVLQPLTSGFSQHVKQKFVYEVPTALMEGCIEVQPVPVLYIKTLFTR
jgi:hypothetical protein